MATYQCQAENSKSEPLAACPLSQRKACPALCLLLETSKPNFVHGCSPAWDMRRTAKWLLAPVPIVNIAVNVYSAASKLNPHSCSIISNTNISHCIPFNTYVAIRYVLLNLSLITKCSLSSSVCQPLKWESAVLKTGCKSLDPGDTLIATSAHRRSFLFWK